MSHFTVGVFLKDGQKLDELLAPYNENKEVEPYIYKTREELEKEFAEYKAAIKEDPDRFPTGDHHNPNHKTLADILKMDTISFARWYYGEDRLFDEEGNLLSTYNPNSKWDWFTIGGRYSNMLITKQGNSTNAARIKDIDWEAMEAEDIKNAEKAWEEAADEPAIIKNLLYGIKENDTKETYLERMKKHCKFSTFAVITPDGAWHEVGQMGWFGLSSETAEEEEQWIENYKKRFIDTADPNWWLVILDCHI